MYTFSLTARAQRSLFASRCVAVVGATVLDLVPVVVEEQVLVVEQLREVGDLALAPLQLRQRLVRLSRQPVVEVWKKRWRSAAWFTYKSTGRSSGI